MEKEVDRSEGAGYGRGSKIRVQIYLSNSTGYFKGVKLWTVFSFLFSVF